jgi:L-Ala-D/L-Glu epimerase
MSMTIDVRTETWPVAGAFVIARGTKTEVSVVVVELSDGQVSGRGEATPIYYHGETAESCAAQVRGWTGPIRHDAMLAAMPRGAARNALDAAFWDYEAKRTGVPAAEKAGLYSLRPLESAITVSLGSPEAMRAQAAQKAALGHRLIKLKLSGEGDLERVAAVRAGAPSARLVVDANEAWTGLDVGAMAADLLPYGVELIEQPVKAGEDHLLDGVYSPIPLCADESCQDRSDLKRCLGRYQAINIKLDKAGGLTESLALASEARAGGLKLMVGCMLSTSLGIAPAWLVAQAADWVDLDGPLLLARDYPGGCTLKDGLLHPPATGFWGD